MALGPERADQEGDGLVQVGSVQLRQDHGGELGHALGVAHDGPGRQSVDAHGPVAIDAGHEMHGQVLHPESPIWPPATRQPFRPEIHGAQSRRDRRTATLSGMPHEVTR